MTSDLKTRNLLYYFCLFQCIKFGVSKISAKKKKGKRDATSKLFPHTALSK